MMRRYYILATILLIVVGCESKIEIVQDDYGHNDDSSLLRHSFELYYGLNEMCVQWTTPFAIQTKYNFRGKLVWGWTDRYGNYGVGAFDERTKQVDRTVIGSTGGADMHNSPSVIELADGRIGVVSCRGHNSHDKIWITSSTHAGDISSFNTEYEVLGFAGTTTYSQVFYINSVYYVFTRTYSSSYGWRWQVVSSPDFIQWSTPKSIVLANDWQYYVRFVKVRGEPTILRMVMYANPSYSEQTCIRMGYIDVTTGTIYNSSVNEHNIIGNYLENNAPFFSSFDIVVQKPSDRNQRFFDVAYSDLMNVSIAFSRWTNAFDSKYYVFHNGQITEICNGGEAYIHDRLQLGARMIDMDNIVAARNLDCYDYIETYRIVNGKAIKTAIIDSVYNGVNHLRINMPMMDEDSQFLFFAKGLFDNSDYTIFDSDLVFTRLY